MAKKKSTQKVINPVSYNKKGELEIDFTSDESGVSWLEAKRMSESKKKVDKLLDEGWTLRGELVFGNGEFVREMTKSIRPTSRAIRQAQETAQADA